MENLNNLNQTNVQLLKGRQKKKKPVGRINRVYSYGCLQPNKHDQKLINEQLRMENFCKNMFIKARIEAREIYNNSILSIPGMSIIQNNIDNLYKQKKDLITEAKQIRTGKNQTATNLNRIEEIENLINSNDNKIKTEKNNKKSLLKENPSKTKEAADKSKNHKKEFDSEIRCFFGPKIGGLCWRTTYTVLDAANTAEKSVLSGRGNFIKYKKIDGLGCLGGQLIEQRGLTWKEFINSKGIKIILYNSSDDVDYDLKYSKNGKIKNYTGAVIKFNLGSNKWVTLPILLHRPIPDNSLIKEAKLQVIKRAGHYYYNVLFTIEMNEIKPKGHGICGLDIGWAFDKNNHDDDDENNNLLNNNILTIGAIVGGNDTPLLLHLNCNKLLHAQSIQSNTDLEFNNFLNFIQSKIDNGNILPRELNNFQKWKSHEKLRNTLKNLFKKQDPFVINDEELKKKYDHFLHRRYVENVRHDFVEQRKHFYRNIAAQISKIYDTVVIEDMSVSGMGRQGKLGKTSAKTQYNWQLKAAATYELKIALKNKGLKVVEINPKHTSQKCSKCGNIDKKSRISRNEYKCIKCDYKGHADINAATNICNTEIEQSGGVIITVPSRFETITSTSIKEKRSLKKKENDRKNLTKLRSHSMMEV